MSNSVVVIGAGAAGMMAAGVAGENGAKVTVIEKNDKPGRKLMITGKGRCNVTNNCNSVQQLISSVPGNGRFLFSAFNNLMPADIVEFFESRGVALKVERGDRIFPVSDKASDIVDCLHSYTKKYSSITKGRVTEILTDNNKVIGVLFDDGKRINCDKVIIATGGKSYPQTGSTGDGYELASALGHTVTDINPSLVPLECHEGFCSELMGLSLRNCAIRVIDTNKNKEIYDDFGEMLFTHFGVSGPMILSASAHIKDMQKGRYKIVIDLKPALSNEQLDARILRDFGENTNRNFINALDSLLPKKLVPVIVKLSKIPMSMKVNQITKEQRENLVRLLKNLTVTVDGFRPIEEAIITRGGVSVKEINPSTMESKIISGLYFAGEVIDVDAYTGGFNLQIAFSTGHLAGLSASK